MKNNIKYHIQKIQGAITEKKEIIVVLNDSKEAVVYVTLITKDSIRAVVTRKLDSKLINGQHITIRPDQIKGEYIEEQK